MELLYICHFPLLLGAPYTITHTSSPFSLISRPSQHREIFSLLRSRYWKCWHNSGLFRNEKKRKVEKESSMISVWLQFSPRPPTQQQRCADVVRAPAHCHAETQLFFLIFFFFGGWKSLQDACGSTGTQTQKSSSWGKMPNFFYFFTRNFPPLRTICESNRGKNRDLYFFRSSLLGTAEAEWWHGSTSVAQFSEKCCT